MWFVDKLGPPPRGNGAQGQPQPAAPQRHPQTARAPEPSRQRAVAPQPKAQPAQPPEPEKKKKKGWF